MKEFQAELPIGKAWNFESLFISFRCLHMYEEEEHGETHFSLLYRKAAK